MAEPSDSRVFTVSDVAYRGAGLARDDGIVTFIPGALPGETVRARIVAERRRWREAALLEVLSPSPDRIAPCCRLADGSRVPGCVYDHAAYGAEVALKDAQLRGFLRRLAPSAGVFLPPLASPAPLGYRNKIVFHAQRVGGEAKIGYLGDDNRTVVDMAACPLANDAVNHAWAQMRAGAKRRLADGASLTFRHTEADGVVSWVGRAPRNAAWLTEKSAAGDLSVPPDGFYQVNPGVAGILLDQVSNWLAEAFSESGAETLLDLYCGVGVFALAAARRDVANVVGVESGRQAVAAARLNAKALGARNARFFCDTVADAAKRGFYAGDLARAVVVADPPRQGMGPAAAEALAASAARNVVYVSCDPATLARDLEVFARQGFAVRRARMLDMFPRTMHFESAVWLSR